MATVNELFDKELLGDACIIDTDSRIIIIPEHLLPFGVESDESSKIVKFKMVNIFDDYANLSFRINYKNADGVFDTYLIQDVIEKDGQLEFSWVIKRNALITKGFLKFIVCVVKLDDNDNIVYEWNTTIAKAPVLEGLEDEWRNQEAYKRDIVAQLRDMFRTDQTFRDALDMFLTEVKEELDLKFNNDFEKSFRERTTKYFIGYDANDYSETGLGIKETTKNIKNGGYNWSNYSYLDVYYSFYGKTEIKRIVPEEGVTFNIRSFNLPNDTSSTAFSMTELGIRFDGPTLSVTNATKVAWDGNSTSNVTVSEAINDFAAGYIYKIVCYIDYKEVHS